MLVRSACCCLSHYSTSILGLQGTYTWCTTLLIEPVRFCRRKNRQRVPTTDSINSSVEHRIPVTKLRRGIDISHFRDIERTYRACSALPSPGIPVSFYAGTKASCIYQKYQNRALSAEIDGTFIHQYARISPRPRPVRPAGLPVSGPSRSVLP